MSRASDDEILAWALARNATIVTLDADFHAMLAVSGAKRPSVIRVRIEGLRAPELVHVIHKVIKRFETEVANGCLLTIKARKTTCHALPIGHSD